VDKFLIIGTFIRINFKRLTLAKITNLKSEKILGYKVFFFDYSSFCQLFYEIFFKNEYYFKSKDSEPIILDAGSSIGMSVIFFKWLYPNSRITAFEPDKETFDILSKNIVVNNFEKVQAHNLALSDKEGEVDFYKDNKNPGMLSMSMFSKRLPTSEKSMVQSDLFSKYVGEKVDFVKMDIEGAEFEVLDDLCLTKKIKNIKEIIVEFHHNIDMNDPKLAKTLRKFEESDFSYNFHRMGFRKNFDKCEFQNVIIRFFNK